MQAVSEPSRLRFLDLGVLAIERDSDRQSIAGQRLAMILALLLIDADRHVSADRLITALWGEEASSGAASTLESHLFRLRKLIEPTRRRGAAPTVLLHEARGYRLVVAPDQVDSLRFTQLAADARALRSAGQPDRALRRCEEALGLWRGQPYVPVGDEPWALPSVTELVELRAQLEELRLECLLATGDALVALAASERVVDQYPLRERMWGHRMLAAYRSGQSERAVESYLAARRVFRDELGLEPGRELQDLHRRILADDPTLQQSAPRPEVVARPVEVRVPRVRTTLIGRGEDMARLQRLVEDRALTTIVGTAGCGKTRLATETARAVAARFPDGVYFVSLIGATDEGQLLDEVTSTLGLAASPVGAPTENLRVFLRGRRTLLVLDNCEHILDQVARLVDLLLVDDVELAVLGTSRVPLGVDGETIFSLVPLAVPTRAETTEGSERSADSPAVQLFLERLRSANPQLAEQPDLAVIARICRSVDGLPLALELAAAQARAFSLDEIATQTETDPAGLSRLGREHPDHHDSVRQAIEWSYRGLQPDKADLHRRIAVLPGPFTAQVAATLLRTDRRTAERRISELVHCSMLVPLGPRRPGQPSRFTQLATVRAHGMEVLGRRQESADVRERKISWTRELLETKPRVGHPDEAGWFAHVDDNLAAIRATLQDGLVDRPHPIGPMIPHNLGLFWYYRGMLIEGIRWLMLATKADIAEPFDTWLSHLAMAGTLSMQNRLDLAAPHFAEVFQTHLSLTEEQLIRACELFAVSCQAAWNAGGMEQVEPLTRQVLHWAGELPDPNLALFAQTSELMSSTPRSAPGSVLDRALATYAVATGLRNRFAAVSSSAVAVGAALTARRPDEALLWADRMLDHHRQLGMGDTPMLMELKANALAMAGRSFEAVSLYASAETYSKRAGMRWPIRPVSAELAASAARNLDAAQREQAAYEGLMTSLTEISA